MNKSSAIIYLFMLILSITTVSKDARSQLSDATIFIDPPSLIDEANILSSFTININISYIEGLHSWSITLRYNPALLYTNSSLIKEGSFLKTGGPTLWAPPRLEGDSITLGSLITVESWADGSGTLANITFEPITRGETTLQISDSKLNDAYANEILHTSQNGYFRNIESTHVPGARFCYTAQAYNVTFDASLSYSPNGFIESYLWFWGGSSLDPEKQTQATSPVASHLYPEEIPPEQENALVRLIVTDSNNVASNILTTMITFGIPVHDLAVVAVEASPKNVLVGNHSSTTVSVNVANNGNQLENTVVTISYNTTKYDYLDTTSTQWTILHAEQVDSLEGLENRTITYIWNTTSFLPFLYVIKGEASSVPGEANTTDNTLTGSMRIATVIYSPVPIFDFKPVDPKAYQEVAFNASKSYDPDGLITSYKWDFGDSSSAITLQQSTIHTFQKAGTFLVTLTVTDDNALSKDAIHSIVVHRLQTTTSLSFLSNTIKVDSTAVIRGEVAGAVSPVNVTVFQRIYGPRIWNPVAYLETDQSGLFSYNWSPSTAGTYQFKAGWNGDDAHDGSESNVITAVAKRSSTISLSADEVNISLSETATLSGSINPIGYGAVATVEYRQSGESWNLAAHILTDENGRFKFDWRPDSAGTYELRAKWTGDDQAFGAESATSTVTVAENPSMLTTYALYATIVIAVAAVTTVLAWAIRRK